MPACLRFQALHLLNTSPVSAPLPGLLGDLRGSFQTQASWLWPHRLSPRRGAKGKLVVHRVNIRAWPVCHCLAQQRAPRALFKAFEHSSSASLPSPPPECAPGHIPSSPPLSMALTLQPLIPASALQTLFPCGVRLTGHGTRAAAFAGSSNGSRLSCITLRHTSSLPIWDHTVTPLHYHVLRLPSLAHTPYLPGLSLLSASRPVLHLISEAQFS